MITSYFTFETTGNCRQHVIDDIDRYEKKNCNDEGQGYFFQKSRKKVAKTITQVKVEVV